VVAEKDDDGVPVAPGLFERVQHLAHARIHVGSAGVIGGDGLAPFVVREGLVILQAVAVGQSFEAVLRVLWQRHLLRRIQVEILFGSEQWQVRLVKAQSEEQRLVLFLAEHLDGLLGNAAIGKIGVFRALRTPAPGPRGVSFILLLRSQVTVEPGFLTLNLRSTLAAAFPAPAAFDGSNCALGQHLVPAGDVAEIPPAVSVVENLAAAHGLVSFCAEIFRQRCARFEVFVPVLPVAENLGRLRVETAQKRRPRRVAQREHALRIVEAQAAGGERVQVWRLAHRIAVTAQASGQVFANDEEHVGLRMRSRIGGGQRGQGREQQDGEERKEVTVFHEAMVSWRFLFTGGCFFATEIGIILQHQKALRLVAALSLCAGAHGAGSRGQGG